MPDQEQQEQQLKPAAEPKGVPDKEHPDNDVDLDTASTPVPYATRVVNAAKAGDEKELRKVFVERVKELASANALDTKYHIVFLFDDLDSIEDFHSDRLYADVSKGAAQKDILLVIHSRGGKIEPAYLISKTCKKLSKQKFIVAVPRRAKSAATLISLGADEIHLGMMSQLGPIDPQVNDLPALGLANGLTKVSQLVCEYPKSAEMWAKYLSQNLSLRQLGYLERLSESAAQYAERLLQGKQLPDAQTPKALADHFVNHYKDHSFLIDVEEVTTLLGGNIIKTATPEYSFANEVYKEFDFISFLLRWFHKKETYFVGDVSVESMSIRGTDSN